jgi:NAD(P)-dependent dehydrogenase (short-subunit alcohol dehydrogenase family)
MERVQVPVYASSKAALNMLTIQYAAAFPRMRINAVDPGFTATDFNAHRGTQTVKQGAEAIVRYAQIAPDGPTGGFFDSTGTEAWAGGYGRRRHPSAFSPARPTPAHGAGG